MSQSLRAAVWISLACAIFLMDHTTCAARLKPQVPPTKQGEHGHLSDDGLIEDPEDREFKISIYAEKWHRVEVTDSTTVGDLKLKLVELTNWPLHHQKVIFQNKQLESNNATMRDIGVEPESNLRLTSGLRGGLANGGFKGEWANGYDFVVRLVHKTPNALGQIEHGTCTGLVQGKFVLTAAHCFSVAKEGEPDITRWTVYTTDGERRIVAGRIHQDYNPALDSLDVAFVELDTPHHAAPVVLDTTPIPPHEKVQIAGFGVDETGRSGNFAVGQFTTTACSAQNRHLPIECAHTTDASPTSTCGGDSGGPWWRMTKVEGKHRVFGVQSFGYDGGCGERTKKSGIAQLSAAKTWLSQYTDFEWYQDPAVNVTAAGSSSAGPQVRVHQSSAPRSHDEPVIIKSHPPGQAGRGLVKSSSIGSDLNKGYLVRPPVTHPPSEQTQDARIRLVQGNAERPATRQTADGTHHVGNAEQPSAATRTFTRHVGDAEQPSAATRTFTRHVGPHPVVSRAPVRQSTGLPAENAAVPIHFGHDGTGFGGLNAPNMQPRLVLPTTQVVNGWRIVDPRFAANRPVQQNVWSASGL